MRASRGEILKEERVLRLGEVWGGVDIKPKASMFKVQKEQCELRQLTKLPCALCEFRLPAACRKSAQILAGYQKSGQIFDWQNLHSLCVSCMSLGSENACVFHSELTQLTRLPCELCVTSGCRQPARNLGRLPADAARNPGISLRFCEWISPAVARERMQRRCQRMRAQHHNATIS